MKEILLVRILPDVAVLNFETKIQWGISSETGELSDEVNTSPLGELKQQWSLLRGTSEAEKDEEIIPDKVILFLPGNMTINRLIKLNSGQKKHIDTVIPYLMEEDLAEDIDSVHIACFLKRKESVASLVAISHKLIQQIISVFDEIGLAPDHIYSECQLLEASPEEACLLLENSSVTFATPKQSTVTLDYEAIPFALSQRVMALDEKSDLLEDVANERIAQVVLLSENYLLTSSSDKAESLKEWLSTNGWLFQEESLPGSIFKCFSSKYFQFLRSGGLVDLRQGCYEVPKRASKRIRRWRFLIKVAVCLFMVHLVITVSEGIYFGNQADKLWSQNTNVYLSVFPHDRQVREAQTHNKRNFDLKKWLENRLKGIGKTENTGKTFLELLQQVSAITAAQGKEAGIVPKGMEYNADSGHMIFEFHADSLDIVDKLLNDLKSKGLNARLDSANQEKVGVIARMTVVR